MISTNTFNSHGKPLNVLTITINFFEDYYFKIFSKKKKLN